MLFGIYTHLQCIQTMYLCLGVVLRVINLN